MHPTPIVAQILDPLALWRGVDDALQREAMRTAKAAARAVAAPAASPARALEPA